MSNETARAAINEALDNALDGELVEVSPTEHEIWYPGLDAELLRLLGSSIAMVDRHYGHLARDSEDSIRARLECSGVEMASEADAD